MNQKRLKSILILFIVFVVAFFIYALSTADDILAQEHLMFSDISSMDILNEYVTEEIKEDKYLGDISPLENFTKKVKYNKKSFYVYAYVFEDASQCEQYVRNRKMSYFDEESYHLSGNIFFSTNYIVYSKNKVLFIDGPGQTAFYEFLNFVQQNFDIKI